MVMSAFAQMLLNARADVNPARARSRWARTAVEGATENDILDMVQPLLNAGGSLDSFSDLHHSRAKDGGSFQSPTKDLDCI